MREATGPHLVDLTPEQAAERLVRLGVPEEDRAEVLATLPTKEGDPERWRRLEEETARLVEALGRPEVPHRLADHVGRAPPEDRCFPVHVYLATLPHTERFLAGCGVPADVVADSTRDLARHMELHRRMYGTTGVDAAWWLTLFLRGEVFDLGRLQFNWFRLGEGDESPLWYPSEEAARRGPGFRPGELCLGVHIPEDGPLPPEACDDAFARAAEFFSSVLLLPGGEPFGAGQERVLATCVSWMLDDQLAGWLAEESNIVRFQRRFELVPGWWEDDRQMLSFVFRRPFGTELDLGALPQHTTLERAAVAHVRSGGHWRIRSGWLGLLPV